MQTYILRHTATGMVLAAAGTAKGAKLRLMPQNGTKAEQWQLSYEGDRVWLCSAAAPTMALNRHTGTGEAILWPRSIATPGDSLADSLTEEGNLQVYLPAYEGECLTATGTQSGASVVFAKKAGDESQYWRYEPTGENTGTGGTAGATGESAALGLSIPAISQQSHTAYSKTFRNQACLATCVLAIAQYFGNSVNMAALVNTGLVNAASAYVNGTGKYFMWAQSLAGAAEGSYCAAITAAVRDSKPVVVKMAGGGTDHYVVACGFGGSGSHPTEITVMDPADGEYRTLAAAFSKHKKAYAHIRICRV